MREDTSCKMCLGGIHSAHVMVHSSLFHTPMWSAVHFEESSVIDLKNSDISTLENAINNELLRNP